MGVEHVNEDVDPVDQQPVPVALPVPYYTYTLLACIAAVFVAQFLTSTDPNFAFKDEYAAAYAGFDKQAFLHSQEYWRILTSATIHYGLAHVIMNSYALYNLGRLVEWLSNRANMAIAFILSVLGGGLLSLVFNPHAVSGGASGGIVGLLSYLAVYAFRRRKFVSAEFRKSLIFNIGFLLVLGLVLFRIVDNFGHLGGLIAGAVYGMIQIPSDEYVDPRQSTSVTKFIGGACVVLYILTSLLTILLLVAARGT